MLGAVGLLSILAISVAIDKFESARRPLKLRHRIFSHSIYSSATKSQCSDRHRPLHIVFASSPFCSPYVCDHVHQRVPPDGSITTCVLTLVKTLALAQHLLPPTIIILVLRRKRPPHNRTITERKYLSVYLVSESMVPTWHRGFDLFSRRRVAAVVGPWRLDRHP